MDFLFQNEDRHTGNLMVFRGNDGYVNLAPIDQGLIFGGRLNAGDPHAMSPENFRQQLNALYEVQKDYKPRDYRRSTNNGVLMFQGLYMKASQNGRAYTADEKQQMIDEITRVQTYYNNLNLDEVFSPANFEKNGAKLSQNEIIHLEFLKKMVESRRETLNRLGAQGFFRELTQGLP